MAVETVQEPEILTTAGISRARLDELADRVPAGGADTFSVTAPATDETIGEVPACTPADIDAAVDRAQAAGEAWSNTRVADRVAVMRRFGKLAIDHRAEILDVIQLETAKSRSDAAEEALDIPLTTSYYASKAPDLLADERRQAGLPLVTTAKVTYDPVGVVGVISPWNFPLVLSMTDVIPALLAGNSVILKPDRNTPYIALLMAELLEEAGLPPGVLQVLTGSGSELGGPLIDRVNYIAFTGSTSTGRIIAERAGQNLIDCSLELGGKNPMVVLDDADMEMTARGAVQGCFTNAGQLCLSAERIYVHESVYEDFLDAFVEATENMTIGTDFDFSADMGSLINADQLETVESHIQSARDEGATIRTGGSALPEVGPYCFEPTIITDIKPDATVACEETFGPVVSVWPVSDTQEAIRLANDSPYGLNGSVWTGDRSRGYEVARQIECGGVGVNDVYAAGWAALDAPMGGWKDSGLGRRHGPEGMKRYLESRSIATSRIGPIDTPPAVPEKLWASGLSVIARVQRHIQKWRP